MDSKPLPARPSLEQYKKQAKEMVKAFRAWQAQVHASGKPPDAGVLEHLGQRHPRFAKLSAEEVAGTRFALADAQFVIALEYGFESWPKFAKHIEALGHAEAAAALSDPVAAFIVAACIPRDAWHASGTLERAEAILAAHPEVAGSNIHAAAILGDDAAVGRFLAADARNATAKGGPYGWDALTHLCFSRYLQRDRARSEGFLRAATALLDAGANPNTGWMEANHQPNPEWESAIYGAAGIAHHAELTRLLLERGADPNDEETPYHVPESYDNDALKVLVESGKLSDANLTMMLLRKTDWHDYEGVKWLLEHGVDPNRMTRWGKTALHHAVLRDNSAEIIEAFLEHGADPRMVAEQPDPHQAERPRRSVISMAARRGRGDILEMIERRGIPIALEGVERLIAACARNDAAGASAIAEQEPELVRELVAEGGMLLAEFAGVGNSEGVRMLLDLGIAASALYTAGDGYFDIATNSTALHAAAWRARPATVKLLIERGAPVNAVDGKQRTPLMLAVRACVDSYWKDRRTPESVQALLDAGASVNGVEYPCGYAEVDELLRLRGAQD
jgi:ankyrin repeat protein